jgi:hypothetical protein
MNVHRTSFYFNVEIADAVEDSLQGVTPAWFMTIGQGSAMIGDRLWMGPAAMLVVHTVTREQAEGIRNLIVSLSEEGQQVFVEYEEVDIEMFTIGDE